MQGNVGKFTEFILFLEKELAGYGAGQLFFTVLRCRISEGRLHSFQ